MCSKRADAVGMLVALFLLSNGCGRSSDPIFCAVPVEDAPVRGLHDAWVTIVEFSDFQCPYCGNAAMTLDQLDDEYEEDQLRIVFKHLPLDFHEHAYDAAIAAECAHAQGFFWEMYDTLFTHQDALDETSLVSYARQLGLDETAWDECRVSQAPRDRIDADRQLATDARVPATPTFFVNGNPLVGAYPVADFRDVVDAALDEAMNSGLPPDEYYQSLMQRACE